MKQNINKMKKFGNYVMPIACVIALGLSATTYTTADAATMAVAPGQPVDLTYAAEKALPSVVHIKYVQNSKVTTVDVQDDFLISLVIHSEVSSAGETVTTVVVHRNVKYRLLKEKLQVLV